MDAHEQLAFDSEICCGVVGLNGEFVMIRLPLDGPEKQEALEDALRRGFGYCGVLGVKDGKAAVQSQPDPDSVYTMMHAGLAFAALVAGEIRRHQGDAVAWLELLHSLPDPRD